MLRLLGVLAVGFGVLAAVIMSTTASKADDEAKAAGKLRHIVLFKFKDNTPAEKIKEIENAFRALPQKIPTVVDFEWGTNNSPEHHADGFTHCFFVTFKDAAGRAVYLPHPAHKAFGKLLHPYLDKVLVIDYEPQPGLK